VKQIKYLCPNTGGKSKITSECVYIFSFEKKYSGSTRLQKSIAAHSLANVKESRPGDDNTPSGAGIKREGPSFIHMRQ
jgi:hypothetical protein